MLLLGPLNGLPACPHVGRFGVTRPRAPRSHLSIPPPPTPLYASATYQHLPHPLPPQLESFSQGLVSAQVVQSRVQTLQARLHALSETHPLISDARLASYTHRTIRANGELELNDGRWASVRACANARACMHMFYM